MAKSGEKGHVKSAVGEDASIWKSFVAGPPALAPAGYYSQINSICYSLQINCLSETGNANPGSVFLH